MTRASSQPPSELRSTLAGELARMRPLPGVVRLAFGTECADVAAAALDGYCRSRLGAAAVRCTFAAAGVGVVFGVVLDDGRRVVVKAHRPPAAAAHLRAVQTAQRHMAAAGVPAPQPLAGPAPLGRTLATAETLLARGRWADPHAP